MHATIDFSTHFAVLDHVTGSGLLVCPDPAQDVRDLDGFGTLHSASLARVGPALAAQGWEVVDEDETFVPVFEEGVWSLPLLHEDALDTDRVLDVDDELFETARAMRR